MYSLGIDIGTSGIRAVVMNTQHDVLAQVQKALPPSQKLSADKGAIIGYSQNPNDWWNTFEVLIFQLAVELKKKSIALNSISHLAIDGTSGTVLLADMKGSPCSIALMYNDQRSIQQAELIKNHAPVSSTAAIAPTSGLAKLLWLFSHGCTKDDHKGFTYALNQSDWMCGKLMGRYGHSDRNNALKMGYDVHNDCWPDWLKHLLENQHFPLSALPEVFFPGQILGQISKTMAEHFAFNPQLKICAGTTDSTAAIIASGAREPDEAITSLGSTLVMKVIAKQAILDQQSGVYSQPFTNLWLVGGSSNAGGEVLKQNFSPSDIAKFTEKLELRISQGRFSMLDLGFYPLSSPGERFPVSDPFLTPKMSPRPERDIDFFQAILEGMADIEAMAYKRLLELGASYPKHVKSIGGGSSNKAWSYIREQKLGIPVLKADHEQAAAGSALLAQSTWL